MKILIFVTIILLMSCAHKKKITKSVKPPETIIAEPVTNRAIENENALQFNVRIIRVSCASIVAVITDDALLDKGESWVPHNARMVKPFKGAFTIENHCAFSKYKEGDSFLAKVITNITSDCVVCTMADFPPTIKYAIKIISEVVNKY